MSDERFNIPDEAIESAARAIYAVNGYANSELEMSDCRRDARAALEAAAPHMNAWLLSVRAALSLHCKQPKVAGDALGPYCAECTSPIDVGPELWPCMTVKAVMDSVNGSVVA